MGKSINEWKNLCLTQFFLLTILSIFTTNQLSAQNIITGTILDAYTGEEVIGASITVASSPGTGTTTGLDGSFRLVTNEDLPLSLQVSFVGYRPIEFDVYDVEEPLTIGLIANHNSLKEVVVVGYGTQKRKELTGSIASIGKETFQQVTTSFDNMLGGAVSGLNVSQSSAQPGAINNIRIRGGNSITGGNEPLYVIDGVLIYNDNSSTSTGVSRATDNFNPMSSINPNDIESVEVLKDVSATAIYGSRGANGVIIITTKSGKKGRTNVEYQYTLGWQTASKKLDLLNARQWAELYLEIATDAQIESSGLTSSSIAALGAGDDWQDAALRTATTQTHQISVSGGDEKTRFLISGNFTDQDGIVINTDFKRYTGRINFERDLFKNFTIGINATASKSIQNGTTDYTTYSSFSGGQSYSYSYALRTSPLFSIYSEDGTYNYYNPYEDGDLRNGTTTPNAIANLTEVVSETKVNALIGSAFAKWTFLDDFTLKLSAATHLTNTTQNYYAPANSVAGISVDGYGSVGNKRYDNYQYEATLNWRHTYGDHAFDVLAGYTTQVTNIEYAVATAEGFANETLTYKSLQSGSTLMTPETGASKSTLRSVLGRVNYTFKDRYHLTATLRADGSSRFAKDHRWGYFPSLGLSWNLNEENFLKNSNVIDELKLRGSIGTVGNQEIGDYQALATYSSVHTYFGNTLATGYVRSNLENSDLKWETTTQYNLGFDLSILKGRVNFIFDVYYKKTSDLLLDVPVELTTGFSSQLKNVGNVTNKGVEFAINASLLQTKNWSLDVSANIAHNKNEVTSLGDGVESIIDDYTIVLEGEALGSFYGWVFDGLVQSDEDLDEVPIPVNKTTVEYGDAKFVDQDGDGDVDQDGDRVVLGSIQPDFTYGFSVNLRYKAWNFSAVFQGSQGNDVYNYLRQSLETPSTSYNVSTKLLDRWTENNQNTTVPKASATTSYSNYLDSRFVEDASYLRLKNITIGYTFPVKLSKMGSSTKIKLFCSAQNLFTITGYEGYDPEVSSGIDRGAYPSARTYSIGVNISY